VSFFQNIEKILNSQSKAGLDQLLYYYGIKISLLRQKKDDVFSRVHGSKAGGPQHEIKKFVGIPVSDDYFPSNDGYSGSFEGGFLYTKEQDILVGDTIKLDSHDNKIRRYKVEQIVSIGYTREVFSKYEIVALNS